jgi:hypothetical protein
MFHKRKNVTAKRMIQFYNNKINHNSLPLKERAIRDAGQVLLWSDQGLSRFSPRTFTREA